MESRLHRIGTIFSRINGLLKYGVINEANKPLWFDVYKSFPPKYEPCFGRPAPDIQIKEIFYPEDIIRAKLHKIFQSELGIENFNDTKRKSKTSIWIQAYNEYISEGKSEEEAIDCLKENILRITKN